MKTTTQTPHGTLVLETRLLPAVPALKMPEAIVWSVYLLSDTTTEHAAGYARDEHAAQTACERHAKRLVGRAKALEAQPAL